MEKTQDDNVIGEVLTPKQEAFCRFYTQNSELMGNGKASYARAYGYDLESMDDEDSVYQFVDDSTMTLAEIRDFEFRLEKKDNKLGKYRKIANSTREKADAVCRTAASRLLTNDNIIARVTILLNEHLQNHVIDARLMKIILKGDDNDAINAIKEYNKLKQRIVDKKDITSGGKPLQITFDPAFNENNSTTPRITETSSTEQGQI